MVNANRINHVVGRPQVALHFDGDRTGGDIGLGVARTGGLVGLLGLLGLLAPFRRLSWHPPTYWDRRHPISWFESRSLNSNY
jgi:hypothetical protein